MMVMVLMIIIIIIIIIIMTPILCMCSDTGPFAYLVTGSSDGSTQLWRCHHHHHTPQPPTTPDKPDGSPPEDNRSGSHHHHHHHHHQPHQPQPHHDRDHHQKKSAIDNRSCNSDDQSQPLDALLECFMCVPWQGGCGFRGVVIPGATGITLDSRSKLMITAII
jgi:hypothetical protein